MTTTPQVPCLLVLMTVGCVASGGGDGASNGWSSGGKADEVAPWSTESGLEARMTSTILPYFRSHGREGSFVGVNGASIHYLELVHPDERGALVISSGRTESYLEYAELAYDLRDVGVSIYILDHRGQGFSDRMLPDRQKGYVYNFDDYVTDLASFMDTVVMRVPHQQIFGLAHSMGGAILATYLERHPGTIDAAVLSSPMFEINAGAVSEDVAWAIAEAAVAAGFGDDYAVGKGPYDPEAANDVSHSDVRYRINEGFKLTYPAVQLGGPTYRWVEQAVEGERVARNEAATMLGTPILLLQSGTDEIVLPGGQNVFCANARHCALKRIPGAGHELIQERDELRGPALDAMAAFFAEHQR